MSATRSIIVTTADAEIAQAIKVIDNEIALREDELIRLKDKRYGLELVLSSHSSGRVVSGSKPSKKKKKKSSLPEIVVHQLNGAAHHHPTQFERVSTFFVEHDNRKSRVRQISDATGISDTSLRRLFYHHRKKDFVQIKVDSQTVFFRLTDEAFAEAKAARGELPPSRKRIRLKEEAKNGPP